MLGNKKRVLFICTHNAARSQMAEGLLRALHGELYEVFSAGTEPAGVISYAVRVMGEIGIDMGAHRSNSIQEFLGQQFDYVVTVCDKAKEACPYFPGGKKILHRSFADPSALIGTEEEIVAGFRRIRDEIKSWIENEFVKL
ncbi:MAG: arsenate reductase ArsC [Syntrophales bacterium]